MTISEITPASRIKYALLLRGWTHAGGDTNILQRKAIKVIATEYETYMEDHLYCPVCFTNLVRTPKKKLLFSNGRRACFAHLSSYKHIACGLRSSKPEGKYYSTEEEASAIASNELVVVSSFIVQSPSISEECSEVFGQAQVEDIEGPEADVPISRHRGLPSELPMQQQTVRAICKSFDSNLYRYYRFPGKHAAIRLVDFMTDIASVTGTDPNPRLYYGVIERSFKTGIKSTHIRMTEIKCHSSVKDFYLKDTDGAQAKKGIADQSKGRIVLIWGSIEKSGIGLCIDRPGWGEYALLPDKYNKLLVV